MLYSFTYIINIFNLLSFLLSLSIQSEKVLSFIPPDGNSRLLSYHIGPQSVVAIPVYLRHNISFRDVGGGRLDITVGPKQTMGRVVSHNLFPCYVIDFIHT